MTRQQNHRNTPRPTAKTEGLSITVSGDETLVYDRDSFVIHRLNAETAAIWHLADGNRTMAMLASETGVSDVDAPVRRLVELGLIDPQSVGGSRLSRRRIVAGAAGAAAAATFVPASAASPCVPESCSVQIYRLGIWVANLVGETNCATGQCCGTVYGRWSGLPLGTTCRNQASLLRMSGLSSESGDLDAALQQEYEMYYNKSSESEAPSTTDTTWEQDAAPDGNQDGDAGNGYPDDVSNPADTGSYDANDTSFDDPVNIDAPVIPDGQ